MDAKVKWTAGDVPFKVSREAAGSLSKQMADGLRAAIASGRLKPGDSLPTILQWSRLLGVSIRVPEAAVAALAREGLVVARKRYGCRVAPRRRSDAAWNGRVLAVVPDGDHVYYQNVLVGRIRARVAEAGYLFSQVTVLRRGGSGPYDARQLSHELSSKPDFALLVGNRPELERRISRAGVPFGVFGRGPCRLPGCAVCFRQDVDAAVPALVEHCRRAGVRRVLQVSKETGGAFDALPSLAAAGIRAGAFETPVMHEFGRAEGTARGALAAFRARFAAEGRAWLPDLLVFTGDYVASGALVAMQEALVRIPEDVRVVSLSNKGLGPVFPVELARVENDPAAHGDALADAVCGFLAGRAIRASRRVVASRYVPGASFP